jgi:hypothetical protein
MADEARASGTTQGRGSSQKWEARKWSGLDNYKCTVDECIFDSFDEADMPIHYDQVHGPNAVVVPPPSPS